MKSAKLRGLISFSAILLLSNCTDIYDRYEKVPTRIVELERQEVDLAAAKTAVMHAFEVRGYNYAFNPIFPSGGDVMFDVRLERILISGLLSDGSGNHSITKLYAYHVVDPEQKLDADELQAVMDDMSSLLRETVTEAQTGNSE